MTELSVVSQSTGEPSITPYPGLKAPAATTARGVSERKVTSNPCLGVPRFRHDASVRYRGSDFSFREWDNTMRLSLCLLAGVGAVSVMLTSFPARADWDGWRRHEWREHELGLGLGVATGRALNIRLYRCHHSRRTQR
jgi:hypothetical protein